jgi:intracellular septation protein
VKLLLDFLPIAIFFIAYKLTDIYIATGVAIVATIVQIAFLRWKTGKVSPMQWLTLAIIVVFGGATIALRDPWFIKWKPSILFWSFAVALAAGQLFMKRNLLKMAMGTEIELPEVAWRGMTWSWCGFFAVAGAVNLWVAFRYSEEAWVNYHSFGQPGLMVVFVIGQALWMARFVKDETPGTGQP